MSSSQEKYLIKELKLSNHKAFEEIYNLYSKKVYAFSLKTLRNESDAESTVQTVFLKLWESRLGLNEELSILAYLFKLTKNHVININKRKIYKDLLVEYVKDQTDSQFDFDSSLDYKDILNFVENAIEQLPDRRKEIFLLNRQDGFTYREIAEKLNISENTVDTQIRNSLNHLRQIVKSEFGNQLF